MPCSTCGAEEAPGAMVCECCSAPFGDSVGDGGSRGSTAGSTHANDSLVAAQIEADARGDAGILVAELLAQAWSVGARTQTELSAWFSATVDQAHAKLRSTEALHALAVSLVNGVAGDVFLIQSHPDAFETGDESEWPRAVSLPEPRPTPAVDTIGAHAVSEMALMHGVTSFDQFTRWFVLRFALENRRAASVVPVAYSIWRNEADQVDLRRLMVTSRPQNPAADSVAQASVEALPSPNLRQNLMSRAAAGLLAAAALLGPPALAAAWLWFDWRWKAVPVLLCLALLALLAVVAAGQLRESGSRSERVGTWVAAMMFAGVYGSVLSVSIWGPHDDVQAPRFDLSETFDPDIAAETDLDPGRMDPPEVQQFGNDVCAHIDEGGALEDVASALAGTGEVTREEAGVIAGVVASEYC